MKRFVVVLFLVATWMGGSWGNAAEPSPVEVRKFVESVCFARPNDPTKRWASVPLVSCYGATPAEEAVFSKAIEELNAALDGLPMKLSAGAAQMKLAVGKVPDVGAAINVHFCDSSELPEVTRYYDISRNRTSDGAWTWWNPDYSLKRVAIFMDRTKIPAEWMKRMVIRQLLYGLGLRGRSAEHLDSILCDNRVSELQPLDVQLLRFYYAASKPGMNNDQIRRAVNSSWVAAAKPN